MKCYLWEARLQLQPDLRPGYYDGMFGCLRKIAAEDGVTALWRYGCLLSVLRETSYGGLQWGLYTPLKILFGTGDGRGTRPGAAASSCRATSAGSR